MVKNGREREEEERVGGGGLAWSWPACRTVSPQFVLVRSSLASVGVALINEQPCRYPTPVLQNKGSRPQKGDTLIARGLNFNN